MTPWIAALLLLDTSPKPTMPPGTVASWSFSRSGVREERTGKKLDLVDSRTTRDGLVLSTGYATTKDDKVGAVSGSFTMEAWAKLDKFNYPWAIIAARGVQGRSIGESYGIYVGQQGEVYFTVAGTALLAGKGSVKTGEWTHLVVTVDRETAQMRIYVNGREIATGAGPKGGVPDRGGPLYVGGCDVVPCHVDFTMRSLRIYDRRLPAAEIERLAKRR